MASCLIRINLVSIIFFVFRHYMLLTYTPSIYLVLTPLERIGYIVDAGAMKMSDFTPQEAGILALQTRIQIYPQHP